MIDTTLTPDPTTFTDILSAAFKALLVLFAALWVFSFFYGRFSRIGRFFREWFVAPDCSCIEEGDVLLRDWRCAAGPKCKSAQKEAA